MKTTIYRIITIITILFMILAQHAIFASMADYTDEQADKITKQNEEEWKQENEERLNKSSNNYLKKLSIKGYNITPEFDKQTINYEIKQEITDDSIEIITETDDEKATVSGNGMILLNSGENNIRIDVTAENGTVRTYFLKATKKTNKNIRLKEVKISTNDGKNIEITPEFNEEIYEYNCTVESYIQEINIDAISNTEDVDINIIGNTNLNEGQNEVLINLSNNNNEKIVYKINVNKKQEMQIHEEKNINYTVILIISISIIILLILILIKKKGHSKWIK